MKCDFCGDPITIGIPYRFKARSFDIGAYLESGEHMKLLKSLGDWIACICCGPLVRDRDWNGLADRMTRHQLAIAPECPEAQVRELITSLIGYLRFTKIDEAR